MTTGKKVLVGCAVAVGVFIIGIASIIALAIFATKGIAETAEQQLAALRAGDLAKAYSYTSQEFQNATSLEKFKDFVNTVLALKDNESSSFSNRKIEEDTGILEGTLKSKDGAVTPVIYQMVKEKDQWKILNIQVTPPGGSIVRQDGQSQATTTIQAPVTQASSTLVDIKLNDRLNKDGYVDEHKTAFKTGTEQIQASAYIQKALQDMTVQATLVFVKTGDKVGPATNQIDTQGDVISSFSFTKPTKGWPAGDYQLTVKLSTGDMKTADFKIEE